MLWGDGIAGGPEGMRRFAEGLNKRYGLTLDVQFTPGPSVPEMASRIIQEHQTGRPSSTDVFVGSETHVLTLLQAGALEAVDWASWSDNVRDPALVVDDGVAVSFQSSTPGIVYNTNKVRADEVPRSLQDLLKPQYKGRVASTPYAAQFERVASPDVWGRERTLDFATRFAEQLSGLIRCGDLERVASGEYDLLAIMCTQSGVHSAQATGAPLGYVIPADAPLIVEWYMAVPKAARHPNAAKLWIDYLLSREAQDLLYELDFIDSHLVPGSKTGVEIAKLQATGVQFTSFNVDLYRRQDERELKQTLAEVQRRLQSR